MQLRVVFDPGMGLCENLQRSSKRTPDPLVRRGRRVPLERAAVQYMHCKSGLFLFCKNWPVTCSVGFGETQHLSMETGVEGGGDVSARVRAAILDYLVHNDDAADTVRGVMNWWLPPEDRGIDSETVERVLEELAAGGFVSVTRLADGTVFYRRLAKS
ncbi:MAG TPA: hypothetical protein VGM17_08855 [Rhizomicrobium sp.]